MVYMREWRPGAHEKEVVLSAFPSALNHLSCLLPPRSSNTKRTAQSYPETVLFQERLVDYPTEADTDGHLRDKGEKS